MPMSYWCTLVELADANQVISTLLTVTVDPANLYREEGVQRH